MATCAFAIIKDNSNRIMLVQIAPPFTQSHKWNFPGGVIENDEDIISGLVREVVEETNIKCAVNEKIDSFMTPNDQDEINIYDAAYVSGEISVQENEIIQAKWCTIKQALELPLAFNIRDYIAQLYT